ncbi:MAG: HDOD domain-containing protein [candidate division Zixibacteria bacterium]|nr:HDOD domain-containing protein [candidate division Zixibacteria bacterium]
MSASTSIQLRDRIIAKIKDDSNLLSLPQSLYKILDEVDKEDFSPEKLADIIKTDPALTARILSLANSAFYQKYSQSTTVSQAVSILEASPVKFLALSSSVLKPELIEQSSGINPKDIFTYVLLNAATAESLANELNFENSEELFIVGLLNDIGLIFLMQHYPSEFRQVLLLKGKFDTLCEAEIEILGIDHREISHLLAKKWQLPGEMVNSIGCQKIEKASEKVKLMQDTINLTVLMNPDKFSGFDANPKYRLAKIEKAAERLSLTKNQLDTVTKRQTLCEIEAARHLGIKIDNIEDLLTRANQEIWKVYFTVEHLFRVRQDLNEKLSKEERNRVAVEAKNAAMATLFHYINNAVMVVSGRSQIMRMRKKSGKTDLLLENLDKDLNIVDKAIQKISAVLEEVKEISPVAHDKSADYSFSTDLDDKLQERMSKMDIEQKRTIEANKERVTSS